MRTRGIVWGIVGGALAITLGVLQGAAPAPAGAAPAEVDDSRVTASEPVAGVWDNFNETADIAVTPNGKWLLAATGKGLTKMSIRRNHIATLGRNARAKAGEIVVHPNSRVAYISYRNRLQVFNIARSKPQLLRTITFDARVDGIGVRPRRGDRLYVALANKGIQMLKTDRPGRPEMSHFLKNETLSSPVVLEDHNRMLTLTKKGDRQLVSLWNIAQRGKLRRGELPLISQHEIQLPGVPADELVAERILMRPYGKRFYVQMRHGANTVVGQFLVWNQKLKAALPETSSNSRQTFIHALSNNGQRVYAIHKLVDDHQDPPGRILWLDPKMTERNRITGVGGESHDLAISPAGRTKGLLYSLLDRKTGTQLRVLSIDPS